jgi:hypothetical protein
MDMIKRPGDELFWEDVQRARRMDPVEKMLSGMRLFESACRITLAGIHSQNPGISDSDAMSILKARVAMQRRWSNAQ